MKPCAICSKILTPETLEYSYGWYYCKSHKLFKKELAFAQRCNSCLEYISGGVDVLMCRHNGRWVILHLRPTKCGKKHADYKKKNKEYENNWYSEFKSRERHYEKSKKKEWDSRFHNILNKSINSNYSKLYLLDNAPIEVVKAAYRALSLLYHPDHGGDEEKMKEINSALDQIMKEK